MKQFRFPNGVVVWNSPRARMETKFIYKEMFEDRCYEQHGVSISDGDVVLDVGANIGMFTLALSAQHESLKVLCFEPVPATRACLQRNIAEFPACARQSISVFASALGAVRSTMTIEYYPALPGNSTFSPQPKQDEFALIVDTLNFGQLWQTKKLRALLLLPFFPTLRWLGKRMIQRLFSGSQTIPCEVRTLSDVITEQRLDRIDLLKIDVEGAVLDVLEGIEPRHWPMIRQLAMEVSAANRQQLTAVTQQLRAYGFQRTEHDNMLKTGASIDEVFTCTLFAVR